MAVQTESIVRPRHELSVGHIEAIYSQAQEQLVQEFYRAQGDSNVPTVVRNLLPSDLNESNNIWAETVTASGSSYQDSQVAGQNIPDDKAIVMFGLIDTSDPQAVTQLRISSGQGVRAIWELSSIIGSNPNISGGNTIRLSSDGGRISPFISLLSSESSNAPIPRFTHAELVRSTSLKVGNKSSSRIWIKPMSPTKSRLITRSRRTTLRRHNC